MEGPFNVLNLGALSALLLEGKADKKKYDQYIQHRYTAPLEMTTKLTLLFLTPIGRILHYHIQNAGQI